MPAGRERRGSIKGGPLSARLWDLGVIPVRFQQETRRESGSAPKQETAGASVIWTRFYSSRSTYCCGAESSRARFWAYPVRNLDPSLPSEIDEPLDEMRLLELFEECGPAT